MLGPLVLCAALTAVLSGCAARVSVVAEELAQGERPTTVPAARREVPADAPSPEPAAMALARSAVLVDARTGAVLYEKAPDTVIPPASLTKLMTLHLIYEALARGAFTRDSLVPVSPRADTRNIPAGSSLMFLEVGQRVTVLELMKGLVVSSGNDAAVAAAELVAGSVPAFVDLMNREARRLELEHTRFADPAGLSAENATTAREYARFCRHYILEHPESVDEIHALRVFAYPLEHNLPASGSHVPFAVEQRNRNLLVGCYPGADGLKTGYIDESGYNLAVTAERDGMRLLAVVLGVAGRSHWEGGENRARVGAVLLDYGFEHFVNVRPVVPTVGPVRVWRGVAETVGPAADSFPLLTLRRDRARDLVVRATVTPVAVAPVAAGLRLGTATVELDGRVLAETELRAASAVTRAPFFRRWYRTTLEYGRARAPRGLGARHGKW